MQNRQLLFSPKIQYKMAAERSEAAPNSLRFSKMWSILEIVRTVFQTVRQYPIFVHIFYRN